MTGEIDDRELLDRLPGLAIDHDNKDFYRGWLDRRLLLNRCGDCSRWHHPPRPLCPDCWSSNIEATAVSGRGVVHLLLKLHQGPPTPGVSYDPPHPVATVELAEQPGLRLSSTVIDCSPEDPLRIGMPVELAWSRRHQEPYPVFRPAARPSS